MDIASFSIPHVQIQSYRVCSLLNFVIYIFPSSDYLEIVAAVFVQSTNNKIPKKPFLHTQAESPRARPGLGNVVLHRGV